MAERRSTGHFPGEDEGNGEQTEGGAIKKTRAVVHHGAGSVMKGAARVSDAIEGATIQKATGVLGGVPGAIRRRTKTLIVLALAGAATYGALQYRASGQRAEVAEAKVQQQLEDEEKQRELVKKQELKEKPKEEISITVRAQVVGGNIILSPEAAAIMDQCGTPHEFTITASGRPLDTEEEDEKMFGKDDVTIQFDKPHENGKSYKYELVRDLYADQNPRSLQLKARHVP